MKARKPLTRLCLKLGMLSTLSAMALLAGVSPGRAAGPVPLSEIPPRAYVVATYDGLTLRLYVNAVPVAQAAVGGPADATRAPLEIGSYAGGAIWSGAIDNVALYDHALPASTLGARYQLGLQLHPPSTSAYRHAVLGTRGLVSYWPLDDLGSMARDIRAHKNGVITHGVQRGAPGLISGEAGKSLLLNGTLGSVKVPPSASLALRRAFTLEAWVTTIHVANRHIVSRAGSWFVKTNAFGQWSAGIYVKGGIVSATSRIVAHGPRSPSAPAHSSAGQPGSALSPLWLLPVFVAAALALALRRRRRRAAERSGDRPDVSAS